MADRAELLLPGGTSGPVGRTHSLNTSDTDGKSFHLQDKQENNRNSRISIESLKFRLS